MLYGVLITFDDYPHIQKTITSIYDLVDKIICVDGRYVDFPGEIDFSTDGTLEYLKSIDKVEIINAYGLQEVEKRNKYLVGEMGDFYLHLDADEVWEGPLEIPDADMGISQLIQLKSGHTNGKRIRLFRHVEGLHYEGKHYWLKDKDGKTFALLEKPGAAYVGVPIEGKVVHHDRDRTQDRTWQKRNYYKILTKRENPIKEVV